MAWTYDLATDTGKIRLRIQDTTSTAALFSDEEIAYFVSIEGAVDLAAAMAFETLAARTAAQPESEKIGDYSITRRSASQFLEQAKAIRAGATAAPMVLTAKPHTAKVKRAYQDVSYPNIPNYPFGPYGNF